MLSVQQISDGVKLAAKEYPTLTKAELVGPYADGNATEDSNVELLMEFTTPVISLFTLGGLQVTLEEILGNKVYVYHAPLPKSSSVLVNRRIPVYGTQ